jgi:hypothetical protein
MSMTGPFAATSTTDDVLADRDLSGKRVLVLVTGVSAGLGIETAYWTGENVNVEGDRSVAFVQCHRAWD